MLTIANGLFTETFRILRACGLKELECQVLWMSAQSAPDAIVKVLHSGPVSSAGGLVVDPAWISKLWRDLAQSSLSIRAQVHTHGGRAFHSNTDDAYPIVGTP